MELGDGADRVMVVHSCCRRWLIVVRTDGHLSVISLVLLMVLVVHHSLLFIVDLGVVANLIIVAGAELASISRAVPLQLPVNLYLAIRGLVNVTRARLLRHETDHVGVNAGGVWMELFSGAGGAVRIFATAALRFIENESGRIFVIATMVIYCHVRLKIETF